MSSLHRTNLGVTAPLCLFASPVRHGLLGRLSALWRSRKALASLSPEQLSDVGLSPCEAAREAQRAVWDVPAHWLE